MIPTCCSCYWDQGRYIGEDPVGHCCIAYATMELLCCGVKVPVCIDCYGELVKGTDRISFGPGIVATYLQVDGIEIVAKPDEAQRD